MLNSPAHPCRYRRFACPLTGANARLAEKRGSVTPSFRGTCTPYLLPVRLAHQTFAFLILDNENYAARLKTETKAARSIHGDRRYVTRQEYIRIWKDSFEFDNFSCTEIASALTQLAQGAATFGVEDIAGAKRTRNSGSALKFLYETKANYGLNKIRLAELLVETMMSPTARRKIENRPIVKTLNRVELLAARNHLPTTQRARDANQSSKFLDRRR